MEGAVSNEAGEGEIVDAETKEVPNEAQEKMPGKKKGRSDFYVELGLFLILGILIGIAVKTEASKKVTIGFDDYKMKIKSQGYNINNLQLELNKKQQEQASAQSEENIPEDSGQDNSVSPSDQSQGEDQGDKNN